MYSNGILVITVEYSVDIESKTMNLNFSFDPSLIKSEPQFLSFKMEAVNGPLTYEN